MPRPKPSPKPLSKPPSKSPFNSKRKLAILLIILAIPVTILLTPPIQYGGFTFPVAKLTFDETTDSLFASNFLVTVETKNVYEYAYSIKTAGTFRTTESFVSTSQGTAQISFKMTLTTPAAQILNLGNYTINGGLGTRSHTLFLGVSEGIRDPGFYTISIVINAQVTPTGGTAQLFSQPISKTFNVGLSY